MHDFSVDILLRLICGLFTGIVIGLDRKLRGKAAGMRTLGLVSLGAAAALAILVPHGQPSDAVSRVLQGLLAGVGFLGAGVIVHRGPHARTQGLTTAAAIWLAAVLGAASGTGYYMIVGVTLLLALMLTLLGGPVEAALERLVGRIDRVWGPRRNKSKRSRSADAGSDDEDDLPG